MSEEIRRIITIEDKGSETLKKLGDAAADTAVDLNKVTVSTTDLKKAQTDSLQGISDVGGALGQLSPKVGQLTTGVGNFKKALNALKANPIILAISAVVGIIYGLVKAIKSNKEAVEQIHKSAAKFKPLVDALKKVLDGIIGTVTKVVTGVLDFSAKLLGLKDNTQQTTTAITAQTDSVNTLEAAYSKLSNTIDKTNKKLQTQANYQKSQIEFEIAELENKKKLYTGEEADKIQAEIDARNKKIAILEAETNQQIKLNNTLKEYWGSDEFQSAVKKQYNTEKEGLEGLIDLREKQIKDLKKQREEEKRILFVLSQAPGTDEARARSEEVIESFNDSIAVAEAEKKRAESKLADLPSEGDYITKITQKFIDNTLGDPKKILSAVEKQYGKNSELYQAVATIINNYKTAIEKTNAPSRDIKDVLEDDEKTVEEHINNLNELYYGQSAWDEGKKKAQEKAEDRERSRLSSLEKILGKTKQTTLEELDQEVLATEEANRRKLESDREYAAQKREMLFNTATALTDSTSRILLGIAQAQDQSTAAGLEAYKKFATASTVISTAGGVMAAIKSGLEAGGPVGWAIAVLQAGAVMAEGYAQLATIRSAGGSGSTSSTGLSGAAKTTVYSPYSTTANIGSASIGALSGIIGDQKVYVTESDITKAQNSKKVKVEESRQ